MNDLPMNPMSVSGLTIVKREFNTIYHNLDLRGLVWLLANNTAGEGDLKRKVASLQASYDKLVKKEK